MREPRNGPRRPQDRRTGPAPMVTYPDLRRAHREPYSAAVDRSIGRMAESASVPSELLSKLPPLTEQVMAAEGQLAKVLQRKADELGKAYAEAIHRSINPDAYQRGVAAAKEAMRKAREDG